MNSFFSPSNVTRVVTCNSSFDDSLEDPYRLFDASIHCSPPTPVDNLTKRGRKKRTVTKKAKKPLKVDAKENKAIKVNINQEENKKSGESACPKNTTDHHMPNDCLTQILDDVAEMEREVEQMETECLTVDNGSQQEQNGLATMSQQHAQMEPNGTVSQYNCTSKSMIFSTPIHPNFKASKPIGLPTPFARENNEENLTNGKSVFIDLDLEEDDVECTVQDNPTSDTNGNNGVEEEKNNCAEFNGEETGSVEDEVTLVADGKATKNDSAETFDDLSETAVIVIEDEDMDDGGVIPPSNNAESTLVEKTITEQKSAVTAPKSRTDAQWRKKYKVRRSWVILEDIKKAKKKKVSSTSPKKLSSSKPNTGTQTLIEKFFIKKPTPISFRRVSLNSLFNKSYERMGISINSSICPGNEEDEEDQLSSVSPTKPSSSKSPSKSPLKKSSPVKSSPQKTSPVKSSPLKLTASKSSQAKQSSSKPKSSSPSKPKSSSSKSKSSPVKQSPSKSSSKSPKKSSSDKSRSVEAMSATLRDCFPVLEPMEYECVLPLVIPEFPITFEWLLTNWDIEVTSKIGEGSFAEVFKVRRFINNETDFLQQTFASHASLLNACEEHVAVLKVISCGGPGQPSFKSLIPEMTMCLAGRALFEGDQNRAPTFIGLMGIHLIRGRYAPPMVQAYQRFLEETPDDCEHVHPNERPDEQYFIALLTSFDGEELEKILEELSMEEKISILQQVIYGLAAAERGFDFEHRDLHLSNLVVSKSTLDYLEFVVEGKLHLVATCGVRVALIDYGMSRLSVDDVHYTSFSSSILVGHDLQRKTYKLQHALLNGAYQDANPKTNGLWVKFIFTKFFKGRTIPKKFEHSGPLNLLWEELSKQPMSSFDCVQFLDSVSDHME